MISLPICVSHKNRECVQFFARISIHQAEAFMRRLKWIDVAATALSLVRPPLIYPSLVMWITWIENIILQAACIALSICIFLYFDLGLGVGQKWIGKSTCVSERERVCEWSILVTRQERRVSLSDSHHTRLSVFFYFIFNVRRIIKDASLGFSSGGRSWTTFLWPADGDNCNSNNSYGAEAQNQAGKRYPVWPNEEDKNPFLDLTYLPERIRYECAEYEEK